MLKKGTKVGAATSGKRGDRFAIEIDRPRAVQLGIASVELDLHFGIGAKDGAEFVEKTPEFLIANRATGIDTKCDADGFAVPR